MIVCQCSGEKKMTDLVWMKHFKKTLNCAGLLLCNSEMEQSRAEEQEEEQGKVWGTKVGGVR